MILQQLLIALLSRNGLTLEDYADSIGELIIVNTDITFGDEETPLGT